MLEPAPSRASSPPATFLPLGERPPALTHGGLAELDPWAEAVAPAVRHVAWPFGLPAVAETLEVIALALVMFLAMRFVAQNFVVDGASMQPNLSHGDLLIVNKLAYRSFDISWLPWSDNRAWQPFGDPNPGDVLVFGFPQDPDRDFIKRVIAVPRQTVEVRDGKVLVDGVELDESFVEEPPNYAFGPEVVPEGNLFVLGDNRNNSYDSHAWGMLDRDLVVGRADLRYWPPNHIGLVDRHHGESVATLQLSGAAPSP